MLYTTITKMSFELPKEHDWFLEIQNNYRKEGRIIKIHDTSTNTVVIEVTDGPYLMNKKEESI